MAKRKPLSKRSVRAKHPTTTPNARHRAFISAYAKGLNATQAAIEAGYAAGSAQQTASRLMSNGLIAAEIEKLVGKRMEKAELSAQGTLEELRRVLYFDPAKLYHDDGTLRDIVDLAPEVRACISSFEAVEIRNPETGQKIGYTKKYKFWSKMEAIQRAMQHFELLGSIKVDFKAEILHRLEMMTPEERLQSAEALRMKAMRLIGSS